MFIYLLTNGTLRNGKNTFVDLHTSCSKRLHTREPISCPSMRSGLGGGTKQLILIFPYAVANFSRVNGVGEVALVLTPNWYSRLVINKLREKWPWIVCGDVRCCCLFGWLVYFLSIRYLTILLFSFLIFFRSRGNPRKRERTDPTLRLVLPCHPYRPWYQPATFWSAS